MSLRFPWSPPGTEEGSGTGKEQKDLEMKPEEVKAKFDKIDTMEVTVNEMKKGVDGINAFLEQAKADREAARQDAEARAARAREVEQNKNKPTFEDDPEAAITSQIAPIVKQNALLMARQSVRDILDNGEWEHYSGAIKTEVDRLIDIQANTGNPVSAEYIQNAYYVAKGKHEKEIAEGKIKSRFSASSSAATGTGQEIDSSKKARTLSDEEKFYAKALGISDEDYAKEAEYV